MNGLPKIDTRWTIRLQHWMINKMFVYYLPYKMKMPDKLRGELLFQNHRVISKTMLLKINECICIGHWGMIIPLAIMDETNEVNSMPML